MMASLKRDDTRNFAILFIYVCVSVFMAVDLKRSERTRIPRIKVVSVALERHLKNHKYSRSN